MSIPELVHTKHVGMEISVLTILLISLMVIEDVEASIQLRITSTSAHSCTWEYWQSYR